MSDSLSDSLSDSSNYSLRDLFAVHAPPRPAWFHLEPEVGYDPYYGVKIVSPVTDLVLDIRWPYHWADLQLKEREDGSR